MPVNSEVTHKCLQCRTCPTAPAGQTDTALSTSSSWAATWADIDPAAIPQESYNLKCVPRGDQDGCQATSTYQTLGIPRGSEEGVVKDLVPKGFYNCFVIATNKFGTTCSSAIVYEAKVIVPDKPVIDNTQLTLTTFTAAWTDLPPNADPLESYDLICVGGSEPCGAEEKGTPELNIPRGKQTGKVLNLVPGIQYSCYLIARNLGGFTCSDPADITMPGPDAFTENVRFFGSWDVVSQPRSISGIAVFEESIYVGMIQGSSSNKIFQINKNIAVGSGVPTVGNCQSFSCPNNQDQCDQVPVPSPNGKCLSDGFISTTSPDATNLGYQPDSISIDNEGRVWVVTKTAGELNVYDNQLSKVIKTIDLNSGDTLYIAVWNDQVTGETKIYVVMKSSNYILNIYMLGDLTELNPLTLQDSQTLTSKARQVAVDDDGTAYVALEECKVWKYTTSNQVSSSADFSSTGECLGLGIYNSFVLVTQTGTNQNPLNLILLEKDTLTEVKVIDVTKSSNIEFETFTPSSDGGFRNIAIDEDGRIYITSNGYDLVPSGDFYLPPGGTDGTSGTVDQKIPGRVLLDRIITAQL